MDTRGLEATFAPGGGAVLGAVAVDPGTTGLVVKVYSERSRLDARVPEPLVTLQLRVLIG